MFALFKHAKNFVAKDETRPLFQGIYFDGNRAMVTNTHLLVVVDNLKAEKQIIHYKTGKTIDGDYPDVDKVIPDKTTVNFKIIGIREWINALKLFVAVNSDFDYKICKLKLSNGELTLSTEVPGTKIITELQVYESEGETEIAFNAKYLHDIFVFFKDMEVEAVNVGINDPLKPIKLTTDRNVSAILTPVRTSC